MNKFNETVFENYLANVMAENKIPGVSVTVVKDNEVVYAKGFGYRNIEKSLPVTPDTIFGIASVTKSFTAMAIMQLVDKKIIDLNEPVNKYLPNFDLPNGKGGKVTIYHF